MRLPRFRQAQALPPVQRIEIHLRSSGQVIIAGATNLTEIAAYISHQINNRESMVTVITPTITSVVPTDNIAYVSLVHAEVGR